MKMLTNICQMLRSGYTIQPLIGIYRRRYLRRLMGRFGFNPWHLSPKELRPYALDLIKYINRRIGSQDTVVEVGCGLGEIIRSIKSDRVYGFDVSSNAIEAARFLDRDSRVQYHVGTFDDVREMKISYFISVNFIHSIPGDELRAIFQRICTENEIEHIVVDQVPTQTFNHKFEDILPVNYQLEQCSRPYLFGRTVQIYRRHPKD